MITESAPVATTDQPFTTRTRIALGASWTLVGYGTQQVMRLGSNLILTRLLAPEVFGLMALANIFMAGLEMLSDVGIAQAIIQSKRGDEANFLDTAWTVQIGRGFVLFVVALALAWPASRIYLEPQLIPLMAVVGAGLVIRGFTATRFHSLNRRVMLGHITAMELISQVLSIGVTIWAAWSMKSVWALAIGAIAGDVARVGLCHTILPGRQHRLLLDRTSINEIASVGRWVFFGTAMTFAASNLDRLLVGRLLSIRQLGVYGIALMIIVSVTSMGRAIGSRVLFPVLAETARTVPNRLYPRLRKARTVWIVPTVLVLLVLAVKGQLLVHFLYRREFHEAGWMLRILAAGAIIGVINQATGTVWPALGEFRMSTLMAGIQVPVLCCATIGGYALHGLVGLVIGCAAVEAVVFPIQAFLVARRGLWQPEIDLPVIGLSGLVVALGALMQ